MPIRISNVGPFSPGILRMCLKHRDQPSRGLQLKYRVFSHKFVPFKPGRSLTKMPAESDEHALAGPIPTCLS